MTSACTLVQHGEESTESHANPEVDYVYVDTAVNGAHRRNQVMRLDTFHPSIDARDVFTTYVRYTEGLVSYAASNPLVPPEKRPSVKGYQGTGFAPFLPVDFDCAADPEQARQDALNCLHLLGARYDVPPTAIRIAFSGRKGFSLEIPGALFGGFAPATDMARRFRHLIPTLLPRCATLDLRIYEGLRLWRVLNTRHGTSSLFKIPLTFTEIASLDLAAIRQLARVPRLLLAISDDEWEARPALAALWAETASPTLRRPDRASPTTVALGACRLTGEDVEALVSLLTPHWMLGQKHHLALGLAGWCAQAGIPETQAMTLVERLSAADQRRQDRANCVRDTYTRHRLGMPVAGASHLREVLPPDVVSDLTRLLPHTTRVGIAPRTPEDRWGGMRLREVGHA